jgi:anthocyanidin reductase
MEKNSHLLQLQALGPLEVLRADLDDEGSSGEPHVRESGGTVDLR